MERCSQLAGALGLNKCSSPPLDLRLDQPLSRFQRPTGAFGLWVVARQHHDSLALRKRSRVLATVRCLLSGRNLWDHGFHATSIALPLARVALNLFHQSYSLPATRDWRRSYWDHYHAPQRVVGAVSPVVRVVSVFVCLCVYVAACLLCTAFLSARRWT